MKDIVNDLDFEILVSTMNRTSLDFLGFMFPFSEFHKHSILIINQTSPDKTLKSDYESVRVINSFETGLSKSRNLAIENAKGRILMLADDDVVFAQNFVCDIISSYKRNPSSAVICFRATKQNNVFLKKYSSKPIQKLKNIQLLNVSSIEITFSKKLIQESLVIFDENFGLGASFELGEEAIFLTDLKKKGCMVSYEPITVVQHDCETSSSKINFLSKYFYNGAIFTRIFKRNYFLWILVKLFFDFKQQKVSLSNLVIAYKKAVLGHETYSKQLK